MDMMIDTLNKKIKEMKELRQREERRDNKAAQEILDRKFKQLTEQIHQLMIALQYAKANMQFQLNETVLTDLENLLNTHKDTIRSGLAEKDLVSKVETDMKSIQQSIKKEWSKQYTTLTNSTISTLKVIVGIDSEHVTKCLEGIAKGENWTTNINAFETMSKSLSNANALIVGLGLDQQIIAFLQKMNKGKATVKDLDEKVLDWLKSESLDKKVRLSFINSGKKC